ncbi:hypothetical protein [Levilactobacillus brevis]|uniref:hypothetical protein n=1 Tax=Levilactobacillus brevis TaxID=1580 RepID=UPI0011181C83|nr:hypothetical protein [Levilactobacillus brevis]QCZ47112.1 hypothetical protein UCCLB556_pA0002 [Levilactobacillus brevis]
MQNTDITNAEVYKRAVESLAGRTPEQATRETLNEIRRELGDPSIEEAERSKADDHLKIVRVSSKDSISTRIRNAIKVLRVK